MKNKRNYFFIAILLLLPLIFSCKNISQTELTTKMNFQIDRKTATEIINSISRSAAEVNEKEIQIDYTCVGLKLPSKSAIIQYKKLEDFNFIFPEIPLNEEFQIGIKIYYQQVVIYEGLSDKIILTENEADKSIRILIKKNIGTVTYDPNKGTLPSSANVSQEYFIDSDITNLPIPVREGYKFEGWYKDSNFSEGPYETLGTKIYLGTVTLYAKWKDIVPPGEIYKTEYGEYKVDIQPGDTKVTLYWENPKDLDFDHAVVYSKSASGELTKLGQSKGTPGEISSYEVTNLTNYVENTFVIKTVDTTGNESTGSDPIKATSYESVPESAKHNTVEVLPAETLGTYGKNGLYVTFGDYPQTVATSSEVSSIDTKKIYLFNNMPCYKDSSGKYYVKIKPRASWNDSSLKEYKDSTTIDGSSDNYFKIEPIKWRVLDSRYIDKSGADKGILLFAEDVLVNSEFATENNKYEESKIRGFLNNGITNIKEFIMNHNPGPDEEPHREEDHKEVFKSSGFSNWAFSDSVLTNTVQSVKISDSADKVFLLSIDELSNNYGFPKSDLSLQGINVPSRQRVPTDYARAKGAFVANNGDETDWWWTRDIGFTTDSYSQPVKAVSCEGNINLDLGYSERDGGVVPAIVVSSNSISNIDFKPGYIVNFDGYYDMENQKIVLNWDDSTYDNYTNVVIKEKGDSFTETVAKGVNTLTITGVNYDGVEHTYTAQTTGALGSSDIIECKVKASELGYVVLKDGTKKHYKSLAESEKANAIAVIFGKVDTKFIGMALQEKTGDPDGGWDGLFWSNKTNVNISALNCTVSGDGKTVTGGYTNGIDSWSKICEADNTAAEHPENYPAFKYANEYGTLLPGDTESSLKSGWYVPTMKDIVDIYNNLTVVNNVVSYVNGTPITSWYWWSCNQKNTGRAYQFAHFGGAPGQICDDKQDKNNTVRCVKQFD